MSVELTPERPKLPTDRTSAAPLPPAQRSRVGNGSALFLDGADGRSLIARRFKDILSEIVSDLGGTEIISEGQRQLARRAATLSTEAETMEATLAGGGELDLDRYVVLTNALNRTFSNLGLRRRPKTVQDLDSYLAGKGHG